MQEPNLAAQNKKKSALKKLLSYENIGVLAMLVVLCVGTAFVNPNFLTSENVVNLLRKLSLISFISIGMAFVIIGGGIDLSADSVIGLGGIMAGVLMQAGWHPLLAVLCSLLVGALFGFINGFFVTKLDIPPFIVTMGTLYIAKGCVNVICKGRPIYPLNDSFIPLCDKLAPLGVPLSVWVMIALTAVAAFILNKTPYGRSITAAGGNEKAAVMCGIKVARMRMISYVVMGLLSAFTGVLLAARLNSAHPASGDGWGLKAIASAIIGGVSVTGGKGTIMGAMIGAAIMAVLEIAMVMMKVSVYWQNIVVGVIIIAAVVLDRFKRKKQA